MSVLLLALFAIVAPITLPAQQQRASIEGTVVKLGTGEPLPNATVRLDRDTTQERAVESLQRVLEPPLEPALEDFHRSARSDRDGRFTFENVAPGKYRLIATYDGGYLPAEYGQRSPSQEGSSFDVSAGQKMTGVQLALTPTGSISGRIYDKGGEPLGNAQVMAMRPVYKNGQRTLTIVQMVATDDRGEYRLFWLAPGIYFVGAKPDIAQITVNLGQATAYNTAAIRVTPPMRFGTFEQATTPSITKRRIKTGEIVEEMYLPVYYPGALHPQGATPISVAAGATIGGVDLAADIGLVRAQHIRGRIIDRTTGQPVPRANVTAVPLTNSPHFTIANATSNPQGLFDIGGVPPGSYQVFVTRYGDSVQGLNGVVGVEVAGKDIENLAIVAIPEFRLSGRFVMENGSQSYPRVASVIRDPEVLGMARGGVSYNPPAAADGSFILEGMVPGDFRVSVQGVPPNGYIRSMRIGNADVLNDGLHMPGPPEGLLEVVIGANAGRIEGTVINARQQPLSNRTVVLVPDLRLRRRLDLYKVVSTDGLGRFRIEGVAPGGYKLFAWENVESGAWHDPAFIGAFENAGRPVNIFEGTSENLQLAVTQ